jgi:RNase P/RNase MRP subunit POP5
MRLKRKPSAKIHRRYLLLKGSKKNIESVILDYIGILGWAEATPVFVSDKKVDGGRIILAVERNSLDKVRGAFELSEKEIKVERVSGTLRALLSSPRFRR